MGKAISDSQQRALPARSWRSGLVRRVAQSLVLCLLALLDQLAHALAALLAQGRVAVRAELLLANLAALFAELGVAGRPKLFLAGLAALLADLAVKAGAVLLLDRLAALFAQLR